MRWGCPRRAAPRLRCCGATPARASTSPLLGIMGVGLGTLIRRSTGAIAALFGLILVLPALVVALPTSIQDTAVKFLPGNAGQAIFTTGKDTSTLPPWLGLAAFAVYAAVALAISLVLARRRDA